MRRSAFTLVELMIVVTILGILAAVVVPQFSDASGESKASALEANLHIIRSQLELYAMQHKGAYPDSNITFPDQMTGVTDVDGDALSGTVESFGPYLTSIPNNPYTDTNEINDPATDVDMDGQPIPCAWLYQVIDGIGVFTPNHDPGGMGMGGLDGTDPPEAT